MLEIRNLCASYGEGKVLEDVSFSVRTDEVVALMGRNGAGKTTTFKSIMGLISSVGGDIRFNEDSITGHPPQAVFEAGISWVPEERRLFTNLTVEDNLRIGEKPGRGDSDNRDFVYEIFPRLEERKTQVAGTMSGGEQQMLALGRALASDPNLLLVDEPFEGLMPSLVTELTDVFSRLKQRETAMLIAGHQNDETLAFADRVEVIDGGRIVHSGDADTLLEDTELRQQYLGVQKR